MVQKGNMLENLLGPGVAGVVIGCAFSTGERGAVFIQTAGSTNNRRFELPVVTGIVPAGPCFGNFVLPWEEITNRATVSAASAERQAQQPVVLQAKQRLERIQKTRRRKRP